MPRRRRDLRAVAEDPRQPEAARYGLSVLATRTGVTTSDQPAVTSHHSRLHAAVVSAVVAFADGGRHDGRPIAAVIRDLADPDQALADAIAAIAAADDSDGAWVAGIADRAMTAWLATDGAPWTYRAPTPTHEPEPTRVERTRDR